MEGYGKCWNWAYNCPNSVWYDFWYIYVLLSQKVPDELGWLKSCWRGVKFRGYVGHDKGQPHLAFRCEVGTFELYRLVRSSYPIGFKTNIDNGDDPIIISYIS